MKDKILAKLFEGFDANLLTDDLKEQVNSMIEELVAERVGAATKELEEKSIKLKQYAERVQKELAEKEKIIQDVSDEFAAELAEQFKQKEDIIMEALEEYVVMTENVLASTTKEFKESVLTVVEEETQIIQEHLQTVALEQIAEYKLQQEADTAKEVDKIKMELVEKVSEFMDNRIKESIPKDIMESAIKVAAYEPLVEGMIKTFSNGFINFNGTGESVIREAKNENQRLSEALSAKTKDNVKLATKVRQLERMNKLASLTEGMTSKQKGKVEALLEKHDLDTLESAFNKIKDMIIEQSVISPTIKPEPKGQSMSNKARSRVEKLQEGVELGELAGTEIGQWAKTLRRNLNSGT